MEKETCEICGRRTYIKNIKSAFLVCEECDYDQKEMAHIQNEIENDPDFLSHMRRIFTEAKWKKRLKTYG